MNIIFTKHALLRMKKRKITQDEIHNVIKSPSKLVKENGKYYAKGNLGRGNR